MYHRWEMSKSDKSMFLNLLFILVPIFHPFKKNSNVSYSLLSIRLLPFSKTGFPHHFNCSRIAQIELQPDVGLVPLTFPECSVGSQHRHSHMWALTLGARGTTEHLRRWFEKYLDGRKSEKCNSVAMAMQYLVWLNYSVVIPPANIKTNNNNPDDLSN